MHMSTSMCDDQQVLQAKTDCRPSVGTPLSACTVNKSAGLPFTSTQVISFILISMQHGACMTCHLMTSGKVSREATISSLIAALARESSLKASAIIVIATIWLV